MPEAYIVDAVRTPVGKRGGGLSQVHPADLGAHVITALVERTGIDPAVVEDVFFGVVDQLGPQAGDLAYGVARGGLPGRGAGHDDRPSVRLVAAGGALRGAGRDERHQRRDHRRWRAEHDDDPDRCRAHRRGAVRCRRPVLGLEGWVKRYGTQEVSQFRGAEMIAEKWDISREDMEAFALESHERAIRARRAALRSRDRPDGRTRGR